MKNAIQALPAWRYKDIISLPFAVIDLAVEASNERRDEQNKFIAAIAGVDLDKDKKNKVSNKKSEVVELKKVFLSNSKTKTATKAEIDAAVERKRQTQ